MKGLSLCQISRSLAMALKLLTIDALLIRKCLTLLSLVPVDNESISESEGCARIRSALYIRDE